MKSHERHREAAQRHLRVRILTISSSRYAKKRSREEYTDEAGEVAETEVRSAGHTVSGRGLVSDNATMIRTEVKRFLSGSDDVLLLAGGTGIAGADITIETVRPFLEKELEGFGELLRRLSYDEVGSAAVLTRATAGVANGKLIVCMPGSPEAVRTALRSFVGEFPHALFVARS